MVEIDMVSILILLERSIKEEGMSVVVKKYNEKGVFK